MTGNFDAGYLNALPSRLYGTMTNETLMAVPLFIFMGIMLEKSKIAEDLLYKRVTSSYRKIYLINLDMNHGSPLTIAIQGS